MNLASIDLASIDLDTYFFVEFYWHHTVFLLYYPPWKYEQLKQSNTSCSLQDENYHNCDKIFFILVLKLFHKEIQLVYPAYIDTYLWIHLHHVKSCLMGIHLDSSIGRNRGENGFLDSPQISAPEHIDDSLR